MLGNNRLDAQCIDGVKRLAHIRGKMRKKVWVNAGDVVLVGLRDYQDGKADVILKYSAEEARALKAYGELPESLRINEATEALGGKERREGREGREKESFFFVFFFRPRQSCRPFLLFAHSRCFYSLFFYSSSKKKTRYRGGDRRRRRLLRLPGRGGHLRERAAAELLALLFLFLFVWRAREREKRDFHFSPLCFFFVKNTTMNSYQK